MWQQVDGEHSFATVDPTVRNPARRHEPQPTDRPHRKATPVGDPAGRPDDVLEPEGDDTWLDLAHDRAGGDERTIRGTVRLDDGRLCIDTNAEARLEHLLGVIAAAVPDVVIVVDDRTDPRAALLERRSAGLPGLATGAALPADQAAFLDELIQMREAAWVDESIPALGGLTPKQALDDPTWREDLLSLLREMDTTAGPSGGVGFDPSRLRALLNL